jgi:spoIIIJ-associated protein
MIDLIEFKGKNTEAALKKAVDYFQLPIGKLEVEILSTGSGGILGLFGKKALIRARPGDAADVRYEVARILQGEKDADRHEARARREPKKAPAQQRRHPTHEPHPAELNPAEDPATVIAEHKEEIIQHARQAIIRMCRPLSAEVEVNGEFVGQELILTINADDPRTIIGRRAQTLDALQYLASRIVSHHWRTAIALLLDVGGYRQRRQRQLEATALKLAQKVQSSGRSFSLGPLNAMERKIIHQILKNKPLQTFSKGQGEFKKVVISPPDRRK